MNPFEKALQGAQNTIGSMVQGAKYLPSAMGTLFTHPQSSMQKPTQKPVQPKQMPPKPQKPPQTNGMYRWTPQNEQAQLKQINDLTK